MLEILPLIVVVFGFVTGMLVNFIVVKLYISRNILDEECSLEIDNLGWLQYLFWPFQSKECLPKHNRRIFVVNLILAVISYWLWFTPPYKVEFWWGFIVMAYFMVVVVMDLEYRVVLYPVSIAGGIIAGLIGIYLHQIPKTLIGGLAGYFVMYLLYKFGEVFGRKMGEWRGQPLEEEALGFGDVYISGIIGLLLGWPGIITGLILGVLFGGAGSLIHMAVMLIRKKFKAFEPIPYAPYLVLGCVTLLYFRQIFLQ